MKDKKSLVELIPPHIAAIRPYVAGKPIEEVERELGIQAVKLASNENPLGPSPKAMEAMKRFLTQANRYPDAAGYYLREKLAERHNLLMDQIVLGAGTTELILLTAQILLTPGDEALTSQHTFVMFPLSVQAAGGKLVEVPMKNYTYDLEAIAARVSSHTKLIYIANPNNPTGTMVTASAIDRLLDSLPQTILLLLDEAYADYVTRDDYSHALDYVRQQPNVLVLRTFSKVHGLAGLRIGYGMGHPELIAAINKVRSPFNVASLAQVAALAALEDTEHLHRSLDVTRHGMELFAQELPKLGLKFIPSFANFIFLETGRDAKADFQALLKMGVIVRPLGFMGMPHAMRVSVGTEEQNHCFLDAFKKILAMTQPGT